MSFYILLVILTIIICIALAFFVLVQNPKGGGLDANFGGVSSNTFGAQRTTDFLEKGTWYLAIALLAISLTSGILIQNVKQGSASQGLENIDPSSTQAPAEGASGLEDILGNGDQNAPADDNTPVDGENQ